MKIICAFEYGWVVTSFLWAIWKVLGLIGSVTLKKESKPKEYGFTALTRTKLRVITGNIKGDGKKKILHPLHVVNVFFPVPLALEPCLISVILLAVLSADIQGDGLFLQYAAE